MRKRLAFGKRILELLLLVLKLLLLRGLVFSELADAVVDGLFGGREGVALIFGLRLHMRSE